jgi:hypothetical protein
MQKLGQPLVTNLQLFSLARRSRGIGKVLIEKILRAARFGNAGDTLKLPRSLTQIVCLGIFQGVLQSARAAGRIVAAQKLEGSASLHQQRYLFDAEKAVKTGNKNTLFSSAAFLLSAACSSRLRRSALSPQARGTLRRRLRRTRRSPERQALLRRPAHDVHFDFKKVNREIEMQFCGDLCPASEKK